jgi:beta-lactam-binding protein with PASTA domain
MSTIFISYRREESAGHAGRIYDRLREKFGRNRVFMDVSAIEPGVDFELAIKQALSACAVFLVVMGRKWLECTDEEGKRRLDNASDFIRMEVATALRLNIRVIPVLVQGVAMPREENLPDDLKPLARRQAIEINDTHWDSELAELVETLERQLAADDGRDTKGTGGMQPVTEGAKSRRIVLIGGAAAVVLALTGLLAGSESFRSLFFRDTPAAAVPKVIGMPQEEAVDAIHKAGFLATVELLSSPGDQPGAVFHQTPPPDSALPAGGTVILRIAAAPGPEPPAADTKVTVPDVVGQSIDRARSMLRDEGLEAGPVEKRPTGEAKEGTVIAQTPPAGTRLSGGKQVRLVVAVKPPGPELVTVPNVVKQPLERAAQMLNDAGLQLGGEDHQPTDQARPGTVLDQKIKGDARVKRGTRVDLIVAAKPPEPQWVTVPAVVGRPLGQAVSILNHAGLQLGAEDHRPTAQASPGTVIDQKPKGNAQAARGSRVDLLVAAPVQGGPIQARCLVKPASIPAGGQAEIRIGAYSGANSPVTGATVRIVSGGGRFQNSGTRTEVGTTNSQGIFTTRWWAPAPAAAGYGMDVTVTKEGFDGWRGECRVPIQ